MFKNDRIKYLIKEADLTLTKVATDLGFSKQYLSNIVNTDVNFQQDKLVALFEYFSNVFRLQNRRLNCEWLLTGQGEPFLTNEINTESREEIVRVIIPKGSKVKVIIENE